MPAQQIHLVRHGEVHNPDHVLYGRLEGFGLSELGHRMAASSAAMLQAQGAPVAAVRDAVIGQNATTLLERFLLPTEIASLVTYLASPLASATNGAALRADGGVLTTTL